MTDTINTVQVKNALAQSSVVFVCEHASRYIPEKFQSLGLPQKALLSHIAWDPGAGAVAERLADHMGAKLVMGQVSRLIYDCNRPPSASDAMPSRSEIFDIPGNANLNEDARAARIAAYYTPFRDTLAAVISDTKAPILVTLHSFTPVYNGRQRDVAIGVLHDNDTRLADQLLATAALHTGHKTLRNQPYGPEDGVTHTLREHGVMAGHLNVMLEIRNDLIATPQQQDEMAAMIARWLAAAFGHFGPKESTTCKA